MLVRKRSVDVWPVRFLLRFANFEKTFAILAKRMDGVSEVIRNVQKDLEKKAENKTSTSSPKQEKSEPGSALEITNKNTFLSISKEDSEEEEKVERNKLQAFLYFSCKEEPSVAFNHEKHRQYDQLIKQFLEKDKKDSLGT